MVSCAFLAPVIHAVCGGAGDDTHDAHG
jgi:hypothetical protein